MNINSYMRLRISGCFIRWTKHSPKVIHGNLKKNEHNHKTLNFTLKALKRENRYETECFRFVQGCKHSPLWQT